MAKPEMNRNISRRQFLWGFGVFVMLCFSGLWAGLRLGVEREGEMIGALLRRNLPYLQLEPDGVTSFSKDFYLRLPPLLQKFLRWTWMIRPVFYLLFTLQLSKRWKGFQDDIVEQYLLSSDFFLNDGNEGQIVHYRGYYDPYDRACTNPFAKFTLMAKDEGS